MMPAKAPERLETPLLALLRHLGRLTGERRRPQLEAYLLEAICDLVRARHATYFKVLQAGADLLGWQAVTSDGTKTLVFDDGINAPADLERLEPDSERALAILSGETRQVPLLRGIRMYFPLESPGSALGLVELDLPASLAEKDKLLIDGLLTAFRNVMGLLDYSEVDTLTGLLNRKTFDEHLMQILANLASADNTDDGPAPRRRQSPAETASHWLAVLDIDHFKRINDAHGHLIGDEVLLMVANLMRATFRFRDKLFRFGGEEFVVVLKPADATAARQVFERFRAVLEAHAFPQVGRVTISIGYAPIALHDQPSVIIERADQALYWAKSHGRNRIESYEALVADGSLAPLEPRASDIELF